MVHMTAGPIGGGPVEESMLSNMMLASHDAGQLFFHCWIGTGSAGEITFNGNCLYCWIYDSNVKNIGTDWCSCIIKDLDTGKAYEFNCCTSMNGQQYATAVDPSLSPWLSKEIKHAHCIITYHHSGRPTWAQRELDDELQPVKET